MAPMTKKLFWQISILLILGLTALGFWRLGAVSAVTNLPVLREVKVRWYAMRLTSGDPEIQASAGNALSRMGPKAKGAVPALIVALDSSRSEVRDAAARVLGEIGPDAEAAVESLIRIQKTEREFLTVEKALGQIGERGLEPLIRDLRDNKASVREHAAESLGKILLVVPDPRLAQMAMEPLINALQDEDSRVCVAATMAMQGVVTAIKDPKTHAKVAEAIVSAMKDRLVHPMFASGVLSEIADVGLEPLINALQDENVGARWCAATAMQTVLPAVKDPQIRARAAKPLIRTVKDADWEVLRACATLALGMVGEPALELLINSLHDEDVRVRRAVAMAMQMVLPAVKDPQIRESAVEPLARAMKDADAEVRGCAGVALSNIGTEKAKDALRNAGVAPTP